MQPFVAGTTDSAFPPLFSNRQVVAGLMITPVLFLQAPPVADTKVQQRGLSAIERQVVVSRNPARAQALMRGRQRLSRVLSNLNGGKVTLSGLRLSAGLSQQQLAEALGTQQPNIARMEKRPGDLTISKIRRLAQVLHADLGEIVEAIELANSTESIE